MLFFKSFYRVFDLDKYYVFTISVKKSKISAESSYDAKMILTL